MSTKFSSKAGLALRFILFVVLGLLFATLAEHMPVGEAAKRAVARIWAPALTASYPHSGQEQVTVVLLDDDDLKAYGETWPVPLGFHQRRLLDLLKYHPKAIFFDIAFIDDRGDRELDGFLDAACRARLAGVRVAVGSFSHVGIESHTQASMLARTVQGADGRPLPCVEQAFLHTKIDGIDQSVWEYELDLAEQPHHGAHGGERAGAHRLAPAAWLYGVDHAVEPDLLEPEMALIWGTATYPGNLDWINTGARPCAADGNFWHRLVGHLEPALCPYQRTLPMRTLKGTVGFSPAQLEQALSGKYVLYGVDLQSTGDIVVSPYHGRMAGTYLHAMALDNLLSFQGQPKRAGEFHWAWPLNVATAFSVCAVVLISAWILLVAFWRKRCLAWYEGRFAHKGRGWGAVLRHRGMRLALWLLALLAALLPISLLFWISYYRLNLGPLVWIEFVLFPLALEFLHVGEEIAEGITGMWEDARGE